MSDYSTRFYNTSDFIGTVLFPGLKPGDFLLIDKNKKVTGAFIPIPKRITFTQTTPSSEWIFYHNFGVEPTETTVKNNQGIDITFAVNVVSDKEKIIIKTEGQLIMGSVTVGYLITDPEQEEVVTKEKFYNVSQDTQLEVNSAYLIEQSNTSIINLILPSKAEPMDKIYIFGEARWRIKQNPSQTIRIGKKITTLGELGYIESTDVGDTLILFCTFIQGQKWFGTAVQGNLFIG